MTTIRPMTRDDVPLVAALEAEVEVTPWSERALEDALGPDYVARVLTDDEGQILSWIVWRTILDESELLLIGTAKTLSAKDTRGRFSKTLFPRPKTAGLSRCTWRCAPETIRPQSSTKLRALPSWACEKATISTTGAVRTRSS